MWFKKNVLFVRMDDLGEWNVFRMGTIRKLGDKNTTPEVKRIKVFSNKEVTWIWTVASQNIDEND